MGRPSKYLSNVQPKLKQIEEWAREGLIDEQIAHNLGIAPSTLYDYKNDHPELVQAIKTGKDDIDTIVENALLKRALGYSHVEETEERSPTGELLLTKRVTKQMPADTTAIIFWLKNRRPKQWRDRQELEHSGETGVKIINDIPRTDKR